MLKEIPYWWDTAPALPNLMTRPLPERADVVIIGSGYTGLSAARSLAQRGAKVVVLEKETFGWGASSRNGGQVLTGLKVGASKLIQTFGRERARELYAASLTSIEYLEKLIADEHIDCGYVQSGHLDAAWKPAHFDHFKHTQEILAREFNHPVRLLDRSEQRHELGTDYYHGVLIDERSGSLHPAQYVRGLAQAAFNAGAALFEKTPALKIEQHGANFKVLTPRGAIEAQTCSWRRTVTRTRPRRKFGSACSRSARTLSPRNHSPAISRLNSFRSAGLCSIRRITSTTSGCRPIIAYYLAAAPITNPLRPKARAPARPSCSAA